MFTIVGIDKSSTKKYASFHDKAIAEKQLASAVSYIAEYQESKDKLTLRVINSILGESDPHHELCSDYRIENTH